MFIPQSIPGARFSFLNAVLTEQFFVKNAIKKNITPKLYICFSFLNKVLLLSGLLFLSPTTRYSFFSLPLVTDNNKMTAKKM